MQPRWDFILEDFYSFREAELRNHLEGMLLKGIRCGFGREKKICQIQTGKNMFGTISKARTRVPEFLVVFGR